MAHLVLLICVSFTTLSVSNGIVPSKSDVETAKAIINEIINENEEGRRNPEKPFIAGFVRLAFHDCVGDGHCDGCINHTIPDNAGLKLYTDALDAGYASVSNKMSRADFYALASVTALEQATEHTTVKFTGFQEDLFKVNRSDCSLSPVEDAPPINPFPGGHFDTNETLEFFDKEFGFTPPEVVALLGAHTLGRCKATNSGFHGKWVTGNVNGTASSDMLDNQWYRRALGNWTQKEVTFNGVTKLQWQRPRTSANSPTDDRRQSAMFLNSDLSLLWNISPVSADGTAACSIACTRVDRSDPTLNCCPRATETDPSFRGYVSDGVKWMADFTSVFFKMINFNEANLVNPTTETSSDASKRSFNNEIEEIFEMLKDVKKDLNQIQNDIN